MAKIFELKQQRTEALNRAESFLQASETANRAMSTAENDGYAAAMAEVETLSGRIAAQEQVNTLRSQIGASGIIPGAPVATTEEGESRKRFSAEYRAGFRAFAMSRGQIVGAAMAEGADDLGGYKFPARANAASYEGSNAAGGYAVPSQVSGDFVPLAPPEMGVYSLVSVVPTTMDTRYVRKDAIGTAAAKAESGGTTNTFGGTDLSIGQFTLSAFMMGHAADASWELLQDVNQFQGFITDDILLSLAVLRESWILSGSGSGQAQGILGNVGAGLTGVGNATTDNYASEILDATFDVQGVLNAAYHPNASFLMNRATSIVLRKAQKTANLFEPLFVRSNGVDYLHGYPVNYSSAMPTVAASATPVLFGDFKAAYILGERGGAGVNVKILDQPKALSGLLTVLGYQRIDGRVRRSEAVQGITLHA